MSRTDCGRLDEPPGLDVSQGRRYRRSFALSAGEVSRLLWWLLWWMPLGMLDAPLRQSSPWAEDAAPPTDTSSLEWERYPLTRGGTHSYCRRIIASNLAPFSDHHRASASCVLVSRRCVRTSQTPCSRYHAPHNTPLEIKPLQRRLLPNASHPQPCSWPAVAVQLAIQHWRQRACARHHTRRRLFRVHRLLQGDVRASPVALYAGRL
jgi:hypothetical protein